MELSFVIYFRFVLVFFPVNIIYIKKTIDCVLVHDVKIIKS